MASETFYDNYDPPQLLDLPEELLENIISFLTYHETSEARLLCKTFNKICQRKLNRGFAKVDQLHAKISKSVKGQLPRRESERRNHALARHVDILSAVETRLSLLGMSYLKYIDMGLCCFIPGKVLDELNCILRTLQKTDQPPRSHEFLQELRDISSMAMEHFDEKIAPILKAKMPAVSLYPFSTPDSCACPDEPQPSTSAAALFTLPTSPIRGTSLRQEINRLNTQMRAQSSCVQQCRKEVTEAKVGTLNQRKKILDQEKKIVQQGQTISELEKKVNDLNQKFIDISAELVKLKSVSEKGDTPTTSHSCLLPEDLKGSKSEDLPDHPLKSPKTRGQKRRAKTGARDSVKRTKY